ncbi:MAG: DUF4293 domain-containing protein [Bacteroidales bacterium]|jgi:hypothetical protein|nr:DUF4293 domain-containing protein [Bacteroidales bacterium]
MIQRIQTIYLILTALLPGIFLKGSFLKFINNSGDTYSLYLNGVVKNSAMVGAEAVNKVPPLGILLALIPVLSTACILLYRKRKLQMKFSLVLILLAFLLIIVTAWQGYRIAAEYGALLQPGINMVFPLLILFFAGMAYRSIKKDEDLVRSYDRLR